MTTTNKPIENALTPVVPSPNGDSPKVGQMPEWIRTFALLVAQGLSIESCAERLQKTPATLKGIMIIPEVDRLIRSFAHESSHDHSTKMIRGTKVDCVLTLIKLRDDEGVHPSIRSKICFYLLGLNYGTDKKGLGQSEEETLGDLVRKNGDMSLEDSLEQDLKRMLSKLPQFAHISQSREG